MRTPRTSRWRQNYGWSWRPAVWRPANFAVVPKRSQPSASTEQRKRSAGPVREGPWSHPAADLPVYTSPLPGLGPPAPQPGGTGRQARRRSQRPPNRVRIAQKPGKRRRKRLNSTNLALVFSPGCLSTCRVPDGGACGRIPKRDVLVVLPEMQGPCGGSGGGSRRPHSDPHSPSSVPESQVRAGPGADRGGSQPRREGEDTKRPTVS